MAVLTTYRCEEPLTNDAAHDEMLTHVAELLGDLGNPQRPLGANARLRNLYLVAGHIYIDCTDALSTEDLSYYHVVKASV